MHFLLHLSENFNKVLLHLFLIHFNKPDLDRQSYKREITLSSSSFVTG